MMTHIDENSIFADEQFGFRLGHSTTHQLLRVTNSIRSNKSEGYSTGAALLDIEQLSAILAFNYACIVKG